MGTKTKWLFTVYIAMACLVLAVLPASKYAVYALFAMGAATVLTHQTAAFGPRAWARAYGAALVITFMCLAIGGGGPFLSTCCAAAAVFSFVCYIPYGWGSKIAEDNVLMQYHVYRAL